MRLRTTRPKPRTTRPQPRPTSQAARLPAPLLFQDLDAAVVVVEAHGTAAAADVAVQRIGAEVAGNGHWEIRMDLAERGLGRHCIAGVVRDAHAHRRETGANSDRPARLTLQRYFDAAVLVLDIHCTRYAVAQDGAAAGLHIGAAANGGGFHRAVGILHGERSADPVRGYQAEAGLERGFFAHVGHRDGAVASHDANPDRKSTRLNSSHL